MKKKLWLVLLAAALAASASLVNAAGSGATGLTSTTNVWLWVGLKNSDDVGTSFDLKAEVSDSAGDGHGSISTPGGSSGFNNARLSTIFIPGFVAESGTVRLTLSVRVSCSSKHNSGTARLWWNDGAANSRMTDSALNTYYLVGANGLNSSLTPGSQKMTKDVFVKKNGCAAGGDGGTWQPFGTWTVTLSSCSTWGATFSSSARRSQAMVPFGRRC